MSIVDKALKASESYEKEFTFGKLTVPPTRQLAVVACMDARLDIYQILKLNVGDAHVIRNAGGIVTVDVMRSLFISQYLMDTKHVMIINHTDCGMENFTDEELHERLRRETGKDAVAPDRFYAFNDLERNVLEQILKVKSHPWTPKGVTVRGFIYDVKTGHLHEVEATERKMAQKK
ncbi:MAG: carbonic anhydrase [Pyrinomonadaceae bacterium]